MQLTESRSRLVDRDLSRAREVAVEAAEAAGAVVRARLFRDFQVHDKGDAGDVVTELDFAAEKLIVGRIRDAFPSHRIISEEVGGVDGDGEWTWLIDPVDGTNNVVIGLPVLAIGIALCHEGVPVVSAVHDPVSRRTWSAVRGHGAWGVGGQALHAPGRRAGRRPLVAFIQGYGVGRDDPTAQALRMVLSREAHRLLDLWAPLTCWTMLARGDIDGIVGYRIGEIDLYAGALVTLEAGLQVEDFSGGPFVSRYRGMNHHQSVLAGSTDLVAWLVRIVSAAERLVGRIGDLGIPEILDGC
jgi:myo-inositol-1(or 4)-monophosphatase